MCRQGYRRDVRTRNGLDTHELEFANWSYEIAKKKKLRYTFLFGDFLKFVPFSHPLFLGTGPPSDQPPQVSPTPFDRPRSTPNYCRTRSLHNPLTLSCPTRILHGSHGVQKYYGTRAPFYFSTPVPMKTQRPSVLLYPLPRHLRLLVHTPSSTETAPSIPRRLGPSVPHLSGHDSLGLSSHRGTHECDTPTSLVEPSSGTKTS